jgi:indolepyruvate ferredoxin oxidoreductase
VHALATPPDALPDHRRLSTSLEEVIERRVRFLTDYQDAAYAARYKALVERVRRTEALRVPGSSQMAEAAARNFYKLMAYKDEYEDGMFEGDYKVVFHLAPPLTARPDPVTGEPQKKAYGPSMLRAFRLLARLKGLRGTFLDPFGRTEERKREREMIRDYEVLIDELLASLSPDTHATAVELAAIPDRIRGFGPVRERFLRHAKQREAELLEAFRARRQPSAEEPTRRKDVAVMAG